MTTKYRLTSLSAENCAMEIYSKMQESRFLKLKTHRLSTLLHQKIKKQKKTIAKITVILHCNILTSFVVDSWEAMSTSTGS